MQHALMNQEILKEPNFETGYNFLERKFILRQASNYLFKIINHQQSNPNKILTTTSLKNIREEDSSQFIENQFLIKLKDGQKERQAVSEGDLAEMIYEVFKVKLVKICIMNFLEVICKLLFSYLILVLLVTLKNSNKNEGYLLAFMTVFVYYLAVILNHNSSYEAKLLYENLTSGVLMLIYAKVTRLSSFLIKTTQAAAITNIINDLKSLQSSIFFFFYLLMFPFAMIGNTYLMFHLFGWSGIFSIVFPLLVLPVQNFISKINGEYYAEVRSLKDKRIGLTTQTIQNIKNIKLYGWELLFEREIQNIRSKQMEIYKKIAVLESVSNSLSGSTSFIASLIVFMTFQYVEHGQLTVPLLFSTLQIANNLSQYLFSFNIGLKFIYEGKVILGRVAAILNLQEIRMIKLDSKINQTEHQNIQLLKQQFAIFHLTNPNTHQLSEFHSFHYISNLHILQEKPIEITHSFTEKGSVVFRHFNSYWTKDFSNVTLKDLNIKLKKGVLYGVEGKIGCGKSTLLKAILGEIPYYSGEIFVDGTISYVEQEPVLFSQSIRENILFGRLFKREQYSDALDNSCLTDDLLLLKDGDQTKLGDRGATLSGGQRARLALARALYAHSDIYLFDDPISAVDQTVAQHIFSKCIQKLSLTQTVILVTHHKKFIEKCDIAIVIKQGEIIAMEKPQKIKRQKSVEQKQLGVVEVEFERKTKDEEQMLRRKYIRLSIDSIEEQEEVEVKVNLKSYVNFFLFKGGNKWLLPASLIMLVLGEVITTIEMRFLTELERCQTGCSTIFHGDIDLFWKVLVLLRLVYFVLSINKYYLMNLAIIRSNSKIHHSMIHSLLRAPVTYFDKTSSGLIINKFSNDLGILDSNFSGNFVNIFEVTIYLLNVFVNIFQINPLFIPGGLIFLAFLTWFTYYSRVAILSCKELDLKNKTPITDFLTQSLEGTVQIKIYNRREEFRLQFQEIINSSAKSTIAFDIISRGFGICVSLITIFILFICFQLQVYNSINNDIGLFGIILIFFIQASDYLDWYLRLIITSESLIISAERVFAVVDLKSEKELRNVYDEQHCNIFIDNDNDKQAQEFDSQVKYPLPYTSQIHSELFTSPILQFKNLSLRYSPQLPSVLNNISLKVKQFEKVGIVGRTGAGKSSIIQALFRMVEPLQETIYTINQLDCLQMGLHTLRQHLSVIPQSPFIFKGSIRRNLDPFDIISDQHIWEALESCQMKQFVLQLPESLDSDITSSTQSMSAGQKQLLCLGRVLLQDNKIVVLDEATSNVDLGTEAVMQGIIHTRYNKATVITIAHRLHTLLNYDKIIVLSEGRIVQSGTPDELQEKKGIFFAMLHENDQSKQMQ